VQVPIAFPICDEPSQFASRGLSFKRSREIELCPSGFVAAMNEAEDAIRREREARAFASDVVQEPCSSVSILNGFGRTLGDGIIGLQALSVAIRVGAIPTRAMLLRLPHLPAMVQAIYSVADFARRRTLPWEFSNTDRRFDPDGPTAGVIDLRDFAFDPGFQQTSMIDYFLERLGVSASSIPTGCKRNTWLAPRVIPSKPGFPPDYILVCPNSSTRLRDMPAAIHEHILQEALGTGPVVTQGHAPRNLAGHAIHAESCKTLEDLCGLVCHARLIISTDTAMVHLADAFDVPCLAFFPTHRPEWRVRDYPKCCPVALGSALPPGIEFSRGSRDEELAHKSWFPDGYDLSWLAAVLTPTLARYAR
jgi:hypothetical protein